MLFEVLQLSFLIIINQHKRVRQRLLACLYIWFFKSGFVWGSRCLRSRGNLFKVIQNAILCSEPVFEIYIGMIILYFAFVLLWFNVILVFIISNTANHAEIVFFSWSDFLKLFLKFAVNFLIISLLKAFSAAVDLLHLQLRKEQRNVSSFVQINFW